jgi:hypothetical protein
MYIVGVPNTPSVSMMCQANAQGGHTVPNKHAGGGGYNVNRSVYCRGNSVSKKQSDHSVPETGAVFNCTQPSVLTALSLCQATYNVLEVFA